MTLNWKFFIFVSQTFTLTTKIWPESAGSTTVTATVSSASAAPTATSSVRASTGHLASGTCSPNCWTARASFTGETCHSISPNIVCSVVTGRVATRRDLDELSSSEEEQEEESDSSNCSEFEAWCINFVICDTKISAFSIKVFTHRQASWFRQFLLNDIHKNINKVYR